MGDKILTIVAHYIIGHWAAVERKGSFGNLIFSVAGSQSQGLGRFAQVVYAATVSIFVVTQRFYSLLPKPPIFAHTYSFALKIQPK